MKLFIVIGCNYYEGGDWNSIRWFSSYEKAEEYGDKLVKDRRSDFYEIMEGEEGVGLD